MVDEKIKTAKAEFIKQHMHLLSIPGGVNGVGIGINKPGDPTGISVMVESSQDVLDKLPKTFMGYPVYAKMIGKIVAQ